MRVIDLTHTITAAMPVYPGTQPPVLAAANTYEKGVSCAMVMGCPSSSIRQSMTSALPMNCPAGKASSVVRPGNRWAGGSTCVPVWENMVTSVSLKPSFS